MRTTPRAVGVVAAMALGLLSACGSSAAPEASPDTTAAPSSKGGELLVVTATGGQLADGTLELTGVDPDVTVFADRPERAAGDEDLADVVADWAELGFVEDPPNAALVTRGEGGQVTTVVELGQPEVAGDTATIPVTPVDTGEATGALSRVPSQDQPDALDEVSLFIDSGSSGTLVPVTIDGTWGSGDTRVALDFWDLSDLGGTWMTFQMGEPGTIQFTASDSFLSLRTPDAISGTFSGVGLVGGDATSLGGQASVPDGSDLVLGACGSGGPTTPLTQGDFELALPATC